MFYYLNTPKRNESHFEFSIIRDKQAIVVTNYSQSDWLIRSNFDEHFFIDLVLYEDTIP